MDNSSSLRPRHGGDGLGHLALARLVPGLRRVSAEAPRAAARQFNTIAWIAFAVLAGTGIWNIVAVHPDWSSRVSRRTRGLSGLSGLTALTALFLGVLLGG